jgi:hypothetical protein
MTTESNETSVRAAIDDYHKALITALKSKDPQPVEELSDIGEKAANLLWQYNRFIAATHAHGANPMILASPPKNLPPGLKGPNQ